MAMVSLCFKKHVLRFRIKETRDGWREKMVEGGGYRLASDYPDVSFKKGKIPIFVIQVPISYPSPQMMGNLASKDWILK